jgi:two-component system cell cycle sensor histidine kinase/response regulator CckA
MSRKWLAVVFLLLAIHLVGIPLYGTSYRGTLLANSVQVASSTLAAVACLLAWRRAAGLSRLFWILVSIACVSWACASLGWAYYENWLRTEVPSPSPVFFLYRATAGFLLMSLFLSEDRDACQLSIETLLDFIQIGIIVFFLYLDFYYVPSFHLESGAVLVRETTLGNVEDLICMLLAVIRSRFARSSQLRELYRGLAIFLAAFIVSSTAANYGQIYKGISSGSWYDLGWTLPFLIAILLASSWKPAAKDIVTARRKITWPELAALNVALAFVPLFVVFRGVRFAAPWNVVALLTLILSGSCYAARLVLYQYQQVRAVDALRENTALLQAVSEGTTEAIYVKDLAGRYLLLNSAGARMVNRPVEEILGKDDSQIFSPETAAAIMAKEAAVLASGRTQTYEETASTNREARIYLSTKGPYRDPSGRTIGLIGISLDITDRKRAEDHFRSLVQNSSDVISIIEADGTIRYESPSIQRILGYDPAALVGHNVFAYVHPDDLPTLTCRFQELLAQPGMSSSAELRFRHANSSWTPLWGVATNLLDDPSVRGIVVNSRNVTEQKHAEKARMEAEVRYRTLVEQLVAVTYIARLGLEGEWLYVSPQLGAMLGYRPEEWLADPKMWISRIHPEDRPLVASAEDAALGGRPFRAEYRLLHRDGHVVWVDDTASVMRDADGNSLLHGVLLDVTERKRLESELHQAQKMQAVGQLAGGIAHDFNNVLTVILGYSQILLEDENPSEGLVHRSAEQIRNAAERAAALTRQLLAFSRKQVLEPRILNLNRVLGDLDKMLRRLITENIQIINIPEPDLGSVKADPAQIEQVLLNLAINARDAMPNGGRLTIETANVEFDQSYAHEHRTVNPGRYVMLSVSDTGSGMDASVRARVFEPFFTTKEMGKGTGLGLATVYGIVQQSGGYIWVYSEPGSGSSFKIYLPRVEAARDADGPGQAKLSTVRGSENILLVEDDPSVRSLARRVLEASGYTVLVPDRVEDVEALCRHYPGTIHLLLTDVVMPGLSGTELARRLMPLRKDMKVIFMSGYTERAGSHEALLELGSTLVQKPFTPSILARKVREVLDQPRAATARGLI